MPGRIGGAVAEIGRRWFEHKHTRSAAAIAFFSLFSLVPLIVITMRLAALVIGAEAAKAEIGEASGLFLDEDSAEYLVDLVEQGSAERGTGWISLLAPLVLLFTASRVVVELREVLALIFGRRETKGRRGLALDFLLNRGVPMLLVLSMGLLVIVSAIAGTILHGFLESFSTVSRTHLESWQWIERVGSFLLITLAIAAVLRWLPPVPPRYRAALAGAVVTTLLLAVVRQVLALYFRHAGAISVYGTAVALVVVLLSIYFAVQIFFIGAETAACVQRRLGEARRPV